MKFRDVMNIIVFPMNDFLIAMSFTLIYYYEGKNERAKLRQNNQPIQETLEVINENRDNSTTDQELEQALTEQAKLLVSQVGEG